jgi:hypothetical protein
VATVERAILATVRAAAPSLRPVVKWGNQWLSGTDLVVAVRGFSRHVGVEFWRGASLPDPARLLEGTGKNLRHVKVRTIAEARSRALRTLVAAAVRLDGRAVPRQR